MIILQKTALKLTKNMKVQILEFGLGFWWLLLVITEMVRDRGNPSPYILSETPSSINLKKKNKNCVKNKNYIFFPVM